MKNKLLIFLLIMFIPLLSYNSYSQVTPPNPQRVPPPGLPIDGGIIGLIAIGAIYGVKKVRK